jgi:hypothetical protein
MVFLYRAMQVSTVTVGPLVWPSARALGVRRDIDIPVDGEGLVEPGTGGMSVSPDAIENLPRHRRPPSHGGTGLDPVWMLAKDALPESLAYKPDPGADPTHGLIEPAWRMPLDDYEMLLADTAQYWELCP